MDELQIVITRDLRKENSFENLFFLPTQVSIGTCDAVHAVTCSDACHMLHDTWHMAHTSSSPACSSQLHDLFGG